jgi:hypothetical protein
MNDRDHIEEHQETIDLVRALRNLVKPREDGGYGLSISEVAVALDMAPLGHGVRAWTGSWDRRRKRFVGGRNLPSGASARAKLRRFVSRTMERWRREFESKLAPPPADAA